MAKKKAKIKGTIVMEFKNEELSQLIEKTVDKAVEEIDSEVLTRIETAMDIALNSGQIEGAHHKMWVIDQMMRALAGEAYEEIIAEFPNEWDVGIAP